MVLLEWAKRDQLDYDNIIKRCIFKKVPASNKNHVYDISVIIPVRGRTEFHKIVTDYFTEAIYNTKLSISITFVEHADGPPMHYWLTKSSVGHIFIPADNKAFNKCLCHNIGVISGPMAKYYLFHDVDIVVPGDFFNMLWQNLKGKDAVQAFTKRRLIMAQERVTRQLLRGERGADFYSRSNHEYMEAIPGAPGGSMCVSKQILLNVGMWDDCFFTGYSVEDQFFFNKLNLMGKLGFCDAPAIELIHLHHTSDHQLTTRPQDLVALDEYNLLSEDDKKTYMAARKHHFLNYFQ